MISDLTFLLYDVYCEENQTKKVKNEIKIMKMKKFIAVLGVAAMMTGLLVGCGNSGEETSEATEETTEVTEDEWDTSNDITIVSREDGSGTRGAFIELFGIEEKINDEKVDMTTEEAQITNSTSVMLTTVAGDDYAIGYVSLGSLDDSVKALKIDGAEATAENVKSGAYKVSRPFNIATKEGADNEVANDFISFILSTEGQQVVEENGYIALDDTKPYEGTAPLGKAVVGGSSSVSPVMEKLIEAYKAVNPNAEIELQTTDSTTGMESTISGSYDIGMASRELKDTETAEGLVGQVIATDGIAVIVNKNSTVDELSSDQVKAIYTGEAVTWADVIE